MGTGSLIHYGIDQNFRIPLLTRSGFDVTEGDSLPSFTQLLKLSAFDAILLAKAPTPTLIRTSRRLSCAPLIYFAADQSHPDDARFDLVIEPLTPPDEWIESVRGLLYESRRIVAKSAQLREETLRLRAESTAARAAAQVSVERAKETLLNRKK